MMWCIIENKYINKNTYAWNFDNRKPYTLWLSFKVLVEFNMIQYTWNNVSSPASKFFVSSSSCRTSTCLVRRSELCPEYLFYFFVFLMLKVFVSLTLRKYTLWLNFLSYKRPQCTSYPFLPGAKYFDLWRLEWLRESNIIFANILSFSLLHPFHLSFTVDVENLEIWKYCQHIINPFSIFNKDFLYYLEVCMSYSGFRHCLSRSSPRFQMKLDLWKT